MMNVVKFLGENTWVAILTAGLIGLFGTLYVVRTQRSINRRRATVDMFEAALRNLVADVDDYERVNNLAPNPGRLHCWESMRVAKDVLGQSAPKPTKE